MRSINILQTNLSLVSECRRIILHKRSNEPLSQNFICCLTITLSKESLIFLKHLIELGNLTLEELRTKDRRNLHILFIYSDTSLTRKNQQLAKHIPSAQIQTRIRLSIASILRPFDNLGKSSALTTTVVAENVVQGTGKHSLDSENLITAVHAP